MCEGTWGRNAQACEDRGAVGRFEVKQILYLTIGGRWSG